jgi:F-type H+-transporting ATPase subunit b
MISINPYEIILQIINFGILYILLKRFLAKPLSGFLTERRQSIKASIDSAESNKRKAESLLEEQKEVLKSAQIEAQSIRKKADESAKKELAAVVDAGKERVQQLMDQAAADIDAQMTQAKKALLEDVGNVASKMAQTLIIQQVPDADRSKLMRAAIDQVTST